MIGMSTSGAISLDRMVRAVEKVRERLLRATTALHGAGVLYAVAGGNAVAAWVSTVDEAAVRNTRDVDILVRREDLPKIRAVLEAEGFTYRHVAGMDVFLDAPEGSARDAVHLVFAGEYVRAGEPAPNPDLVTAESAEGFRVLPLRDLVTIKLTAFRDKDRTHLRDMLEVGLIDGSWVAGLPSELGARLQALIDDPNG
jgi:hypothetical protein